MEYCVGDRVVSLINDSDGLKKGEEGTIVKLRECATPIIEWDKYNPCRHEAGGYVPDGHGWYVHSNKAFAIVKPNDFGEFTAGNQSVDYLLFST